MPYTTPDGYFEALQQRLSAIPSETREHARKPGRRPAFATLWAPSLALASFFAAAVILGNLFLSRTTGQQTDGEEEIIEYLIASGTTLAQLYETDN